MSRMLPSPATRNAAAVSALGAVLLAGSIGAARLDAQAVRATIFGTVKDSSGATMPGVTIEARNAGTGVAQTVVTNEQGRFTLPDLPLGMYDIQASMTG